METSSLISIPGSERFVSRPMPIDELRAAVPSSLRLHEVNDEAVAVVDPLTHEVIRHRIWSITDEMADTLRRMSGAPSVTEANDFDFAICDELGQEVQVGLYNILLVASMDLAIYWMLKNRADNPGIKPGDMFFCNDPWVGGGAHQSDSTIIAPIFCGDELFGWTSAVCHLTDIGGAKPGSVDLTADDIFREAAPTPPIKIVREGKIQADVLDMIVRRSRMPQIVTLDLRAMVGANKAGHRRIQRLIQRYGPDVVKSVMKRMMNEAEGELRSRLAEIPDGSWRATGYMEQAKDGDRGMHRIELELRKSDQHLEFDFHGTDPQIGMINSPFSGARAGVTVGILSVLAGDLPWSPGGFMRCFDVIAEEGTINNASFPAAVGWAPISSAWATLNLVIECLGKMLNQAPERRHRAQAGCTGSADIVTLAGTDQRGDPTVLLLLEEMAGGFGAHADRDGADTAGIVPIVMGRMPDVEMFEFMYPLMYLWRREEADSGGPGLHRGGASVASCLIPHSAPDAMAAAFTCNGKARPEANGLAGGYPGGAAFDVIVRGAAARELLASGVLPSSIEELGGAQEIVTNRMETILELGDAIYMHPAGGGGYGDPLRRFPDDVASDVRDRKVSREAAEQIYGVVLRATGDLDKAATAEQRRSIRRRRLGSEPQVLLDELTPAGYDETALDGNLTRLDHELIACRHCGFELGAFDGLRDAPLVRREFPPESMGPGVGADTAAYVEGSLRLTQAYCPGCATAFETDIKVELQDAL